MSTTIWCKILEIISLNTIMKIVKALKKFTLFCKILRDYVYVNLRKNKGQRNSDYLFYIFLVLFQRYHLFSLWWQLFTLILCDYRGIGINFKLSVNSRVNMGFLYIWSKVPTLIWSTKNWVGKWRRLIFSIQSHTWC